MDTENPSKLKMQVFGLSVEIITVSTMPPFFIALLDLIASIQRFHAKP